MKDILSLKNSTMRGYLIYFCFAAIVIIVAIYYERTTELWPFTKGTYQTSVSGKIYDLRSKKESVEVRLTHNTSKEWFYFSLSDNGIVTPKTFLDVVKKSDSLWKPAYSDTIYTIDFFQKS